MPLFRSIAGNGRRVPFGGAKRVLGACLAAALLWTALPSPGQAAGEPAPAAGAARPAPTAPPAPAKSPDTVIARDKKGRIQITQRDLDLEYLLESFDFEPTIEGAPEDEKAAIRQRYKVQVLNELIDRNIRYLEATKDGITVSDDQWKGLITEGSSPDQVEALTRRFRLRLPGDKWMVKEQIPNDIELEARMAKLRKKYKVEIVDPEYQDRPETGLKKAMPKASYITPKEGNPPVYKAFQTDPETKQSKHIGYVFFTTDVNGKIRGHDGPIKMLVGLDLDGKITGVQIYRFTETGLGARAWLDDRNSFQKFVGKSVWDRFVMGEDLDAVAQSTVTVTAVGKTLRETGRAVARAYLKGAAGGEGHPAEGLLGTGIIVSSREAISLALLAGFLGLVLASFFTKNLKLRYVTLVATVVYVGFIKSGLLGVADFVQMAGGELPPIDGNLFWWVLAAFTAVTLVLAGRVYCGSICPFGALQDLITAIVPKKWQIKVPWKLHQKAIWIKYAALAGMFAGYLFFDGDLTLTEYEPFNPTFQGGFGTYMGVFLGFLFIAAVFIPRFFCRYLCGLGALLGVATVVFPWRMKRVQQCTNCKICMKGCPVGAIDGPKINRMECVRCDLCERNLIELAGACRKPARPPRVPEGGVRRELPMAQ